jgi:polyhydroxybutyrate depolymerase
MRQNFCIKNDSIYATGKSNGGGFVGTLACAPEGGNFAAFAPVSGAFYTDSGSNTSYPCKPARAPLPILEFHGTNDTTIPYNGETKSGGVLPPIPEWLAHWAVRDGCPSPPTPQVVTPSDPAYMDKVHITSYSCGKSKDIVQGYKIDGLGHTWPSTEPNSDSSTPTVIEATSMIMDFFRKHTKP